MAGFSLKVKLFDSGKTRVVPVAKPSVTVGSAGHCDVVLEHESVHPEHLRAWFDSGRVWVQDMGSAGGTFLNGIRLPSLKPMPVRELDALRIGACPVTVGFEPSTVRAPMVRPQNSTGQYVPPEAPQPEREKIPDENSEIDKRRDELVRARRELAELKLQLQMGRLDKEAEDEAHRQLSQVREELREMRDQKVRLNRDLGQMDQQRQSRLAAVDKEITDRKATSMNQLKNLMDHEMSKLADWKMQVMGDLRREIHSVSQAKAKLWVTRPLSNDMILDWESDIQSLVRKALLGEKEAAHSYPETDLMATAAHAPEPEDSGSPAVQSSGVQFSDGTKTSFTPITGTRRVKRRSRKVNARAVLAVALMGVLVLSAVLFKKGVIRPRDRSLAGGEFSTSSVRPAPQMPLQRRYEPQITAGFKKTYADNVLFTENFVDLELNPTYRSQWLVDLSKAATDEWKVGLPAAKLIADKELALLQDLKRLRGAIDPENEKAGIQVMRERESHFLRELEAILGGRQLVDKYQRLKRTVFTRLQAKKS